MFGSVLISLLVGLAVFGFSFPLGNFLLNNTVYSDSFSDKMSDQKFSALQEYVEEEQISPENLQQLDSWFSPGNKVFLRIYRDGIAIYESPFYGKARTEQNIQKYDLAEEDPDRSYTLTLGDDTAVRAFVYYYGGEAYLFWMTVIAGFLAFVAFSLCFVVLVNRKVVYITRLKEELDIISGGQLEYPVTVMGKDELAELALGIDQMRQSIKKHNEVESQMRSANSELITAMSHDLRTPLTSLLAYLEIIERKKYTDEAQKDQLVHKSINQAMRIKTMADQLFEYFLVYATEWEPAQTEVVEADPLFEQILEDYAYALECKGMKVEMHFTPTEAKLAVNLDLLQRVLDNLYSNLQKYADPTQVIQISCEKKEGRVCVSMQNGIRADSNQIESTGIGLNTCKRVITQLGGTFTTEDDGKRFSVTVALPVVYRTGDRTGDGSLS